MRQAADMTARPSCGSCVFADLVVLDDVDLGETPHRICRRFPPQVFGQGEAAGSSFPLIHDNDWCGEWATGGVA